MISIQDIQARATPVLGQFGVKRAALFGSTVRGDTHAGSDVDMLVELGRDMSLFEFIDLKQQLEETLNSKVDLVQFDRVKESLKPFIMQDAQTFYQL